MLKDHVTEFEYPGLGPSQRSRCDLYVYELTDGHLLAVASERNDNPGASVTNTAEHAATAVLAHYAPGQPERLIWIERYPPSDIHGPSESIDLVHFAWDSGQQSFHSPNWQPWSRAELETTIGESFPEIASRDPWVR